MDQVRLPDLSTVGPYPVGSSINPGWLKVSSFGLFEHGQSLFYFQIDYFGDVFVLEQSKEALGWIQFTVEGDKFEVSTALGTYILKYEIFSRGWRRRIGTYLPIQLTVLHGNCFVVQIS
jgi:hypothetical protein